MKKRLAAILVMALILCWASSAMALTAVAADHIDKGTTRWDALEPQADFMHYTVSFDKAGKATAVATSGSYRLEILYDGSGKPADVRLQARALNDKNDMLEIGYRVGGGAYEALYWTGYVSGKGGGTWPTHYTWAFDASEWRDGSGKAVAGIPAFKAADYPLTVIYAGEDPVRPSAPPVDKRVTVENPLGKLAIMVGEAILDYTGFETFEGAKFYFEHGVVRDDMDGLTMIDGTWYNMDLGRVNTDEGLVFFEGGVFYVRGGTIAYDMDGMVPYDGEWFVFSKGQFQPQVYGAWPDHRSGKFVYIWGGQFYPITDLVSYDGQIFYFINGYLATDFVGYVKDFKGKEFYVAYGQVY